MAIAKFSSELKEDNQLFKFLAGEDAPKWWQDIKDRKELYIDIRKDNYISVYYLGASIAKIEMKRRQKRLSAITHPKYLGHNDHSDPKYYKERFDKKHNKIVYDPIYQDCEEEIKNNLDGLLARAYNIYINRNDKESKNPENIAEKKIQGQIILNSRPLYIDSEFAHRYEEGERKTVRIDLVRVKEGKIQFVELKRIQDKRMLHTVEEPEILTQIQEYKKFLSENKSDIIGYYKTLLRIKKNLSLPTPDVVIDDIDIDTTPVLLIADYMLSTEKRTNRKEKIEGLLREKDVIIEYIEYANNHS